MVIVKRSEDLWFVVLKKLGCPPKLLIIRSLHHGMKATVAYKNKESNALDVNNGVKQSCALALCSSTCSLWCCKEGLDPANESVG